MSVQDRGDADDIDRRFAQLVQGWQSPPNTSRQAVPTDAPAANGLPTPSDSCDGAGALDADRTPPGRLPPAPVEPAAEQRHGPAPAAHPTVDSFDILDDEPFRPPAAPPIPVRPGVAIGFALLGVALLLAFLMLMGVSIGAPLGAVAGTLGVVGLVVLLLNVRRGPRDDSLDYDPRDGSRL